MPTIYVQITRKKKNNKSQPKGFRFFTTKKIVLAYASCLCSTWKYHTSQSCCRSGVDGTAAPSSSGTIIHPRASRFAEKKTGKVQCRARHTSKIDGSICEYW